jgi:hypothetical protein
MYNLVIITCIVVSSCKKKPNLDLYLLLEELSTEAATAGVTVLLVEDNKATRYQRAMYR